MRGRDPARVHPSCVAKVQARARLVTLAREAFGGESAEGAAGRVYSPDALTPRLFLPLFSRLFEMQQCNHS